MLLVVATVALLTIVPSTYGISPANNFNFTFVQQKARSFYATLPQTIQGEAKMMVPAIVKKHGYPCETHKVTTTDGYIVTIHRIPYGRSGPSSNRPVVYVQHGLMSSSADWIITGPEKALAYILADAGYDVWLGNTRGSRYSRDHKNLRPNQGRFWDFTWHQIAIYDLPAMIDYILDNTKQQKLFYIAHSQGTTAFYVMCSEKPEYNDKIKAQFSLAPVAYMSRIKSMLLRIMAKMQKGLGLLLRLIGVNEFSPNSGFLGRVSKLLCSGNSITNILCTNSLFAIGGFNHKLINSTLLPVIMAHTPASASTKQFLHYAQLVNSGQFRQWDYGYIGNLCRYGSIRIPTYKLDKVIAPVYLFYSLNDWLSAEQDVLKLYGKLGNVREKVLVADKKFTHTDYLYAINARELVYDLIINLMKKY